MSFTDAIKYVEINNARIAYHEEGEGTPLVFLNGILMSMASWQGSCRALSGEYYCLRHDFRGQLHSSKNFPSTFDMGIHVEDLRQLLDVLALDRVHLIGTSYGGEVALLFALRYPERVRSLSIIASVSYSESLLERQVRLWQNLATQQPSLLYDAVVALSYSSRFLSKNSAAIDQRREYFAQLPSDFFVAFQALCDAFLQLNIPATMLATISCPTLIIGAAGDILKVPAYSRHMAKHIPQAQLEIIPDAGHAVVIEQAENVNQLLSAFLQSV